MIPDDITHRPVPCSTIIREASSVANGNKYRHPELDNVQKVKNLETIRTKWDVSIKSLPLGSGNSCQRGVRKSVRAGGNKGHYGI